MPSQAELDFVDPSAIAVLVRKNGLIAISQLPAAFAVRRFSTGGLAVRVRAAVESLLKTPNAEFSSYSVPAHPGAIDSWGLLWSSEQAGQDKPSKEVFVSICDNWAQGSRRAQTAIICHSDARNWIDQSLMSDSVTDDDWLDDVELTNRARKITARVLCASVFIDLLKRDPQAARSWQVLDNSCAPFDELTSAASYCRSDGRRVLAIVPPSGYDHYGDDDEYDKYDTVDYANYEFEFLIKYIFGICQHGNRSRPGVKNWSSRRGGFWRHQGYVVASDHARAVGGVAA